MTEDNNLLQQSEGSHSIQFVVFIEYYFGHYRWHITDEKKPLSSFVNVIYKWFSPKTFQLQYEDDVFLLTMK